MAIRRGLGIKEDDEHGERGYRDKLREDYSRDQ
jgi:hypothetical protein